MNKLQGKKTETDSSGFSVLFRLKKMDKPVSFWVNANSIKKGN